MLIFIFLVFGVWPRKINLLGGGEERLENGVASPIR